MQAVGRLGSYISKSVYTVSGPFHPFGGAVDIIVVEQPDGSYKSSPWYVKFGKFQGVLKTKEKVVSVDVNGVKADFHMFLNHKGEAYFLKEVEDEELESVCSPPSSSGEDTDGNSRRPMKSKSCNYDSSWSESIGNERKAVTRANSRRSQIFGLVFGKRSTKEEGIVQEGENELGVIRTESLDRAEIAADLLDLKWSTNLLSSRRKKDNDASRFSDIDISKDEVNKNCQEKENNVEVKCLTEKYVVETAASVERVEENTTLITDESGLAESDIHVSSISVISEVAKSDGSHIQNSVEKLNGDRFTIVHEERISVSGGNLNGDSESIVTEYSRLVSLRQSNDPLKDIDAQTIAATSSSDYSSCSSVEKQTVLGEDEIKKNGFSGRPPRDPHITIFDILEPKISEEEQLLFGDMDDFDSADDKQLDFSRADDEGKEDDSSFSSNVVDAKCCSEFPLDQSIINDYITDDPKRRKLRSISSDPCIKKSCRVHSKELTRMVRSLPIMGPLGDNLEASDKHHQLPGAHTMSEDDNILQESKVGHAKASVGAPPRPIGSQRSWPFTFKKSRSMKVSHVETNGLENPNAVEILNNSSDLEGLKDVSKVKVNNKKVLRVLTPTSEQLASLNLKEGKNIVVFTFQTPMLGKQQVDARIFMWRWDTRIVISDVDGTITRSDLLGQVMPLVGMDWSQTGVAHLFSAIKENGYQLIFLSARSIAQSFLTRQFLFNIKQDGKALPDGPVVISPDGLFPSLFREVVRRAPHEFKIACLEDIKALFPAGTNPFYAGFGNRDTDEFSYLKVGIPRGKIFIINPKGEIAVNRRVDTKSYLSLHALVHGMFPSMSSSEQEDFNTWNYWKLPPPIIDV